MPGQVRRIEREAAPKADVRSAVTRARDYLLSIQDEDGHWCGELEGDTILESEYILTMHFIGRLDSPKVKRAANWILENQLDDGGWAIYPGGPAEVSASVKAYFVLKMLGHDVEAEHMARARKTILALGGIEACNSFTRLYLAIFGQLDWKHCPAIPPEIMLLPRWFYFNIYEMSSWSRGLFVPLSIIWANKLRCPVPAHAQIDELKSGRKLAQPSNFWKTMFYGVDLGLKLLDKLPVKPSRQLALKQAERWILERLEGSDGLGAIFPPIVYTIFALRCLGYSDNHPTMQGQVRELEKLELEDGDSMRVQPCFGPVWDTGLAINALVEAGVAPDDPTMQRAAEWLLEKRGHDNGDWRVKTDREVTAPGWFFEYANPFYPDNDTTAKVITALSKVRFTDTEAEARREKSLREAHEWHLSMQNLDGGWGAFDKDCSKEILTQVPFADHNAMIDPSNEDITARILETFAQLGEDKRFPPAQRAIKYLLDRQESDGAWYGRWGCNYLYGTYLALWGLDRIGADVNGEVFGRAAEWIRSVQNDDGGWGESPASYEDPTLRGVGPSTASQTAWALLGLFAAGDHESEKVRRGVHYLCSTQQDDGSWSEVPWTGTGFPAVFYLKYHLYAIYFPLFALARYRKLADGNGGGEALSRSA